MSLPPLAPVPPANVRLSLAPEEWSACLDAWLAVAEFTLQVSSKATTEAKSGPSNNTAGFLRSFYHESSHIAPDDETLRNPKAQQLQKACFRLVHRILIEKQGHEELLDWKFLGDFCHVHVKNLALARFMTLLWKECQPRLELKVQAQKSVFTSKLEHATDGMASNLQRLAPILRASPDIAALFMTGSDFLDALASFYVRTINVEDRKAAVLLLYLGLESLVKVEPQNVSMLSDHLYSLKTTADNASSKESILADLITNTPLVARSRRSVNGEGSDRLFKLLDSLETYRSSSIARPRKRVRRKVDKGKGKGPQVDGELHMHRMSLVTQVQDLFPDLGSGFIMKLLDEYDDNVEQVTAHLLDDSLPPHLQTLDRTEKASIYTPNQATQRDQLAPRSTPPPLDPYAEPYIPSRRNVFDDDELDRLEMDTSRLHIGKRNATQPSNTTTNKAAILSALAAFDSDDDERDDTYDVDDVGGTVDTAHPDGEPALATSKASQEENDAALFKVHKASPELFGRTFDIRRGQARQALKAETGMTDEAIEGWAIMLRRDPKRLTRMESKFGAGGAGAFNGTQGQLGRTAYRESPAGTETEDSDAPNAPRGGFRGRGRGRGGPAGRGRGRGGNVAGPSSEAGTAAAQRRKEESKGSRANHNRRDQRARKMRRGGIPFAG